MARAFDLEPDNRAQGRTGVEREVASLADRQHGVVSHAQLAALGFRRSAIQRRVKAGRLHRLHRGVYAVGRAGLDVNGRWLAAVLACGPGALLSHRTAAALWGLRPSVPALVDVTVAGTHRRGRAAIGLHQPRALHADERAFCEGIPVTSVARTMVDLAPMLSQRQLERCVEDAEQLRLFDLRALTTLLDRAPPSRATRLLADVLQSDWGPEGETRSPLERCFLDLCRDAGLPMPLVNVRVAGVEVDAVWFEQRLVVELDGHAFHRTRAAFERDRVRDATLQVAGYRVVRITHRRLMTEGAAVVAQLRTLLREPVPVRL